MAMMPHPERTEMGDPIFQSMRDYIAANAYQPQAKMLDYYPRQFAIPAFQKSSGSHECIIELAITDNHALTVQNTLRRLGYPVTVKRYVHWEIHCDKAALETIKKSGVLYNERKEAEVKSAIPKNEKSCFYLIRSKDDLLGQQKCQSLQDHFSILDVNGISHGVLWKFEFDNSDVTDRMKSILNTNIIHNPYAHDCYQYN
jgi:phosphoribosylformylglycinamidine synthase